MRFLPFIRFLILLPVFVFAATAAAAADDFSQYQPGSAPQQSLPSEPYSPIAPVSGRNQGYVEAGGDYSSLDKNQKDWYGEYLRSAFKSDSANTWNLEVDNQNEFGNQGTFEDIGDTHIWTDRFFTALSAGTSENGNLFMPNYRVDGNLYYRFLPGKNLVGNIGAGYYDSKIHYHDQNVNFGASYYFSTPWIVEGGMHLDFSDPGNEFAPMAFAAVTWGHNKRDFLTLRYAYGKEAYEDILINNATGAAALKTVVGFDTSEFDVVWRHWFNNTPWGFNARGEYYTSKAYDRVGGSLGVFREF